MQHDPDPTITLVQSSPASWLKEELLLGAASALTIKTRLPIGSRELQKPEKSNRLTSEVREEKGEAVALHAFFHLEV